MKTHALPRAQPTSAGWAPDSSCAAPFAACSYIDSTTHPLADLGERYVQSFERLPASSALGVLLRTCHRIEWYQAPTSSNETGPSLPEACFVHGHGPVLVRLAQIAAGTKSLIAGERFVFGQVSATFASLSADHCLRHAAAGALSAASEARRRFDLYARLDYPALAERLLDGMAGRSPRVVVIIGGGVLARALAARFCGQRKVVMVTRRPKKLRRDLATAGVPAVALRVFDVGRELDAHSYDTIIATSGLDAEYRGGIAALVGGQGCRATVDLCTVPTLGQSPTYRHLNHPDVIKIIEDANQDVAARAAQASAWLEDRVGGPR